MSSPTEICNLALSHLGIAKEIANLTEASAEAEAMNRFFETANRELQRDFPWTFNKTFFALGLVEEDPTTEWAFSYRYPSDCLKIRRILSGQRNDTRQSRVPYVIASDDSGQLIYSDVEDVVIEYSRYVSNAALYPIDYVMAFSYKLAYLTAARLTGGDPFKKGDAAMKMYVFELSKAATTNANEEEVEEEVQAEAIRARS